MRRHTSHRHTSHHHTFVTGFLAFGGFQTNPSAMLAESSYRRFEVLEVAFAAVDQFLDRLDAAGAPFDQLVMLGLRGQGTTIDLERVARNHIGATPDVRGVVRGPGPIEAAGPDALQTTLLDTTSKATAAFSDDAGCYLCNYFYYRALRRFPAKRVGFVHVPTVEAMPLDAQRRELARLLEVIEGPAARGGIAASE